MSALLDKQKWFAYQLSEFIVTLCDAGYEVTIGEVYRPAEMAAIYAAKGAGILQSLHTVKLAADLNIFRAGNLLASVTELEDVGRRWENRSSGDLTCCWGGRFSRPDADHFSVAFGGRK